MKNTLELKQLAGYLPYCLKCKIVLELDEKEHTVSDLIGLGLEQGIFNNDMYWFGQFKPILYPLSDLTKEIEVNGERFVPIVELARLGTGIDNYDVVNHVFVDEKREQLEITNKKGIKCLFAFDPKDNSFCLIHAGQTVTSNNQLAMFQKLYEWKFDIHGLIEKGLAINKNNL